MVMQTWWPRIVILTLLALIVGVPAVIRRSETPPSLARGDRADTLVIMTPHNEQIRHEFGRAFNRWRSDQGDGPIQFDWRTSGGTSDLRKSVFAQFAARIRDGREDDGIGCDLFFGGGDYEHGVLARGIKTVRNGKMTRMSLSRAARLPDGLLGQVFPEPNIGSEPLYDPQLRWIGVALSSFGIVYNRDVVERVLRIPEPPRQWRDLAHGRYRHWLALADPAHSGSIAATYNAILRREGWNEGWKMLRRVFANARYFTSSASKVPVDVSAGEAAAGMCIDFYGRFQAGAIRDDRVGYVDPKYTTAITADPISILRGAPHFELANQFVVWLLSSQAQQLWQRQVRSPGGPEKFELRRLPIRRDVYGPQQMANWTDQVNPYKLAKAFPDGIPNYYRAVAPVAHAMAIDIHDDLQAAWATILDEQDPLTRQRMVDLFDAMPPDVTVQWPDEALGHQWRAILQSGDQPRRDLVAQVLQQFMDEFNGRMGDRKAFLEDRLRWTRFFRDNYREVVRMTRRG